MLQDNYCKQNAVDVLNVSSPRIDAVHGTDGGDIPNSCWQSSWFLTDKLSVDFTAEERSCGDISFPKTFPLSHL